MLDELELYKLIGERLASARKRRPALTQDIMAKRLGLTRVSISNIERGKQKTPLSLIYKYCLVLNKDVFDILPKESEVLADKVSGTAVNIGNRSVVVPTKVAETISKI